VGLSINTRVIGADDFSQLLEDTKTVHIPEELESMMDEILRESILEAEDYPPETAGNQPPPPYYQRGRGMIGFDGGVIKGKESQNLKGSWRSEVIRDPDGVSGRIINFALYAGLVQDEDIQTVFHAAHGWRPIQSLVRFAAAQRRSGPGATAGPGSTDSGIIARVEGWLTRITGRFK
jgi:hypothetical protein